MKKILITLALPAFLSVQIGLAADTNEVNVPVDQIDPKVEHAIQSLQVLVKEAQAAGMSQEETFELAAKAIENNALTGEAAALSKDTQRDVLLIVAGLILGAIGTYAVPKIYGYFFPDKTTGVKSEKNEKLAKALEKEKKVNRKGKDYKFSDGKWKRNGDLVSDKKLIEKLNKARKVQAEAAIQTEKDNKMQRIVENALKKAGFNLEGNKKPSSAPDGAA